MPENLRFVVPFSRIEEVSAMDTGVLNTKVCPTCGSVSVAPELELTDEAVYYCCCCGTHFVGDKDIRDL
jgi:hypothetical protein